VTFRFDAPLFIANVNRFIEDADTLLADGDPAPDAALVSAQAITDLDVTALDAVTAYVRELRNGASASRLLAFSRSGGFIRHPSR
jgi:hypothetical protein